MRHAGEGRGEHVVHFLGGQRDRRRVEPDVLVAMALHQRAGVAGVGFQVQHAVGVGVQRRIVAHLLERRQADHRTLALDLRIGQQLDDFRLVRILGRAFVLFDGAGLQVLGADVGVDDLVDLARTIDARRVDLEPALGSVLADKGGAAHVGDLADGIAARQPLRHLDDGALGVAVEQNVGGGVHQDRTAHLVRPVIVMADAPQRRLDAAQHYRHVLVGFLAALAVDQAGAVGPLAGQATRGVGIVGTYLAVGGVAVDHRVHVAGGDTEEQIRLAELHEVVFALPVRLADDADAKALGLQQPPDDRHAERRMVDVGIAGDDDDVARIPAELIHLLPAHRQERRRTETFGPVLGIVKQRLGSMHGEKPGQRKRARNIAQKITSMSQHRGRRS